MRKRNSAETGQYAQQFFLVWSAFLSEKPYVQSTTSPGIIKITHDFGVESDFARLYLRYILLALDVVRPTQTCPVVVLEATMKFGLWLAASADWARLVVVSLFAEKQQLSLAARRWVVRSALEELFAWRRNE